jgi:uncharacterized MAPEG superfamily protein
VTAQCFVNAMSQVAFNCLSAATVLWVGTAPLRYIALVLSGIPLAEAWRNPRGASKLRLTDDLLQRCEAVHANAGEGLPLFIGAVLAAVAAGVPAAKIDELAIRYVASRVAYTGVYLASTPKRKWLGPLRSVFFGIGFVGSTMALFLAAANKRGEQQQKK